MSLSLPMTTREIEAAVRGGLAALLRSLAAHGCTVVGHMKGTLSVAGRESLSFHAVGLRQPAEVLGGFTSPVAVANVTLNVIVFGLSDELLPELVANALTAALPRGAVWRSQRGPVSPS